MFLRMVGEYGAGNRIQTDATGCYNLLFNHFIFKRVSLNIYLQHFDIQ